MFTWANLKEGAVALIPKNRREVLAFSIINFPMMAVATLGVFLSTKEPGWAALVIGVGLPASFFVGLFSAMAVTKK